MRRLALALLMVVVLVTGTQAAPYARPPQSFEVPDFSPGLPWFNVSHPLSLKSLRGKMVLLDFWTYG